MSGRSKAQLAGQRGRGLGQPFDVWSVGGRGGGWGGGGWEREGLEERGPGGGLWMPARLGRFGFLSLAVITGLPPSPPEASPPSPPEGLEG